MKASAVSVVPDQIEALPDEADDTAQAKPAAKKAAA